eukprot:5188686-Alexandrium_andersonii.AAC.1
MLITTAGSSPLLLLRIFLAAPWPRPPWTPPRHGASAPRPATRPRRCPCCGRSRGKRPRSWTSGRPP